MAEQQNPKPPKASRAPKQLHSNPANSLTSAAYPYLLTNECLQPNPRTQQLLSLYLEGGRVKIATATT
jgi:hypothetical protein